MALVACGVGILAMTMIFPIIMLESTLSSSPSSNSPVSLHGLVQKSLKVEEEYKAKGASFFNQASQKIRGALHVETPDDPISLEVKTTEPKDKHFFVRPMEKRSVPKRHPKAISEAKPDNGDDNSTEASNSGTDDASTKRQQRLARGVSGLPMVKTPALIGARPGHVDCDVDVDDIVYWNDPQGDRDRKFASPYATPGEHYLTFEPDMGGWNNIRMSMEVIFVLAAATGRTLVLPPKQPFYLLGMGKEGAKSFGNFYPLDQPDFKRKVKIITMEEFLEQERHNMLNLEDDDYEKLKPVAELCTYEPGSPIHCKVLFEHLREVGFQPDVEATKNCLVFDMDHFQGKDITDDVKNRTQRFCGAQRTPIYYGDDMHFPQLIHWNAGSHEHRLLNHFYSFMYFTDPKMDNYYKRFVRDYLHYKDNIYCAAVRAVSVHDLGHMTTSESELTHFSFSCLILCAYL